MRRTELGARTASALIALSVALALVRSSAHAQPKDSDVPAGPSHPSLRSRLGLATAEGWLTSERDADHLRAIERLGSDGSPHALALIATGVAPGGSLTNVEERLTAARVLAPYAATNVGRQTLIRLMSGSGLATDESSELERFARRSAALALADSGDPEAIAALSRALRHEGSVAEAAALALAAHPPGSLGALLGAGGRVTPTLVELLDELGDQRAAPALRELVRHGTEPIRIRAALALARLGDPDTVELARYWLTHSKSAALHRAAAELLALGHADDAGAAIAALLDAPATRSDGLALALKYPVNAVAEPIARHLAELDVTERATAYAVLGRSSSPRAIRELARAFRVGPDADLSAYALATCPSADAKRALAEGLADPARCRDAARAGVVRALCLGDGPDGLTSALARLLTSKDAADRAAGAWGTAALDAKQRLVLIGSKDAAIAAAAARTATDADSRRALAQRLARRDSPRLDAALAIALVDLEAARAVPTSLLIDLLEAPATAALAARALAARAGDEVEPRIAELLASGDPVIRAHTALGLGERRDPSAIGRLAEAYRFEADASVRRAIVRALAIRGEPTRRRTLELAQRLDPDAETRQLAALALRGVRLEIDPPGDGPLWLTLSGGDAAGARALTVVGPTGLAIPLETDPDGRLTVWGLPKGVLSVRLAPASARGEASGLGSHLPRASQ